MPPLALQSTVGSSNYTPGNRINPKLNSDNIFNSSANCDHEYIDYSNLQKCFLFAWSFQITYNVIITISFHNSVRERAYQENLPDKFEVWRGGEVESVEKEWEKFRDIVLECTNDVCGMRRVAEHRRKGSEWWNEEVDGWIVSMT